MGSLHIAPEALDVLRRSRVEGFAIALPSETLDRSTYTEVDKVLKAIGGKWNRTRRAHVFASDPRKDFETITKGAAGTVATPEAVKIFTKKNTLQAFYTPTVVAQRLVDIAHSLSEHLPRRFLEPSAGEGEIVKAIERFYRDVRDFSITSVNVDLTTRFVSTFPGVDFLTMPPRSLAPFDAVIMNPPFAKGQDVTHVLHAWEFVRPGGVLVAIVSPAYQFRKGSVFEAFRRVNTDRQLRGGVEIELPADTFKESGTNVRTVIVGWVKS